MKQFLREVPAIHEILQTPGYKSLIRTYAIADEEAKEAVRDAAASLRSEVMAGHIVESECTKAKFLESILEQAEASIRLKAQNRLCRVINGTGTVLHTNLGRARLSEQAIQHAVSIAGAYSNLEYRLHEGVRGSRHDVIEDLVKKATGAEAAMVVNNNAAAVYLVLRALAKDKEVVVSRGELVEIGGSFRISSIMEESGAKLVEIGTTNKTHLYDYENAVQAETAMVLKVHTSNFRIEGFTESVAAKDLFALKRDYPQLILYEDLGSGSLYDFQGLGIGDEPVVGNVIEQGIDLISFSGDKLLGGPQAGIIAGKAHLIAKLKQHQLARVLRVDKMTLAALESTLASYLSKQKGEDLPTVRDIIKPVEDILGQAEWFQARIAASSTYEVKLVDVDSAIGGGTMPGIWLPSVAAALVHNEMNADELAEKMRTGKPAIVPRIKDDHVLIDFRTVAEDEMEDLVQGVLAAGGFSDEQEA